MNKKVFIGIGVVLGVALLAGAAFMAARLFGAAQPAGLNSPLSALGVGGPGGNGSFSVRIEVTPAPEVPQTEPDTIGQVTDIKDNSIFVAAMPGKGAGGNAVVIGKVVTSGGSDSGPSTDTEGGVSPTPSGPVTEVVISKDTLIYRDTSMDNVPKPSGGSTNISVQQTVELIDISQVAKDFMVQVWGQKRGDRVIAEKIVVMGAMVVKFNAGAGDAPPK